MVVSLKSVFERKWVPVRVKKTRQNLKPFAGVGVTDGGREEAETEGQHDDVQHEMLLCGASCEAGSTDFAFVG
jgi:hypothetical protein